MFPHKTCRGEAALARLKAFDGIPPPYDRTKRMVVPDSLKVLRLQLGHKYCLLGQLSKEAWDATIAAWSATTWTEPSAIALMDPNTP
ncbi:hypothetical protein E2562_029719 [Oryza meyeriana var. granulata]|uniref:Uncharacterized protein n=1 Tax=Oryza meyeriana var. granulata TaxID=110450 RepID=A0A6G1C1U8_9ORYZ|nr:hypothetical protein E2562_029719 [Oryza meyeriana var. granulata]